MRRNRKEQTGRSDRGFTLIEVMISMSIFTILTTVGIGSVLAAINQHRIAENQRTVMDNLNFVMEDMARNIRLGTNMRCVLDAGETTPPLDSSGNIVPQSCPGSPGVTGSNKVVFRDQNGNQLMYVISIPTPGPTPVQIIKQRDAASTAQVITPPEVVIDWFKSGFTVRGAEPNDLAQPTVVIRLAGKIVYKGVISNFAIETTVTLRALDS